MKNERKISFFQKDCTQEDQQYKNNKINFVRQVTVLNHGGGAQGRKNIALMEGEMHACEVSEERCSSRQDAKELRISELNSAGMD